MCCLLQTNGAPKLVIVCEMWDSHGQHCLYDFQVIQETNVEAPENLPPIQDDDGSDDDGAIMFTPHTIGGKSASLVAMVLKNPAR